jgi:tol-pal system protein YbgF
MKWLKNTFFAALVPIFFGCATVPEHNPPSGKENLRIVELKKSVDETNIRLDELNNKFLLLQEKVVANTQKLNAKGTQVVPPKGLKVIKLKEEEAEAKETPPNPEGLYGLGQDLFIAGRYEKAREVFSNLVERFPAHGLADNALYWVGESYYSEKDYDQALIKFKEVVDRYPDENKAPDSLLKVGYSYIELEDMEKGADVLKRLLKDYPESEAADKAGKKLREISN